MKNLTVTDVLIELLKFKSVTPDDDGALNYISMFLGSFDEEKINENDTKTIFLKKKFAEGPHICFAGHIDVASAGEGWESEPFNPLQKDGYIYARGAQKMKSGIAAMMCAMRDSEFKGTLSLLLTSDEQNGFTSGIKDVLEYLKQKKELADFAIVCEPTCETSMGDNIKIGHKGDINGVLRINSNQGDISCPNRRANPLHMLATKFHNMAGYDLDEGDEFFEPSKIVITDILSDFNNKNQIPESIKVLFNVKNSKSITQNDIKEYIRNLYKNINHTIELKVFSKPFLTNKDSKIVLKTAQSIEKICGITPKLSTTGQSNISQFFAQYDIEVIEFGVMNDKVFKPNERVSIDETQKLYEVFKDLIKNFNS